MFGPDRPGRNHTGFGLVPGMDLDPECRLVQRDQDEQPCVAHLQNTEEKTDLSTDHREV